MSTTGADDALPTRRPGVARGVMRFAVRNPYVVWLTGCGVYVLAVVHRASLGVAGPEAVERLQISSAQLGAFVMLQLGVYAAMQIPAGLAIDRWGARRVLLLATLILGTAQVTFALATTYPVALLARTVLGVGDALVFISVMRLAATWFPRSRYAVMAMWTGLLGMLGNLAATVPLTLALDEFGWTRTFAVTGATSLVYALLLLRPAVAAPFREVAAGPGGATPGGAGAEPDGAGGQRSATRELAHTIAETWRGHEHGRGTQVGFWVHQATMASGMVLGMVWGFPYLTEGLGYPGSQAAAMVSVLVLGNVGFSFLLGPFAGRRPGSRVPLAIGIGLAIVAAWAVLLAWPGGRPPVGVVVVAFVVMAAGGPGSQIGFHLARDYNPAHRISTATGLVNAGGFSGTMLGAISIGVILDQLSGTAQPSLTDYRIALSSMAVLTLVSTALVVVSTLGLRRSVLERLADGLEVRVPVVAHWWDRAVDAVETIEALDEAATDPVERERPR